MDLIVGFGSVSKDLRDWNVAELGGEVGVDVERFHCLGHCACG